MRPIYRRAAKAKVWTIVRTNSNRSETNLVDFATESEAREALARMAT